MEINKKILAFYNNQGKRTQVKKGVFSDFPNDIPGISKIIQGLLIHPCMLSYYKLDLGKERMEEASIKNIEETIERAKELSNSPLVIERKPAERVINICKHFTMFLVALLREKGIPTRSRCGFATYFVNGRFEDHWVCEYWDKKEERWVLVDSQVDEAQIKDCNIDIKTIDLYDLPKGGFFPAGVLWQLYRKGQLNGKICGFSLSEGESGERYIRGNMLRDFFALNKIEYTYGELSNLMKKEYTPNEEELKILDKIAEFTIEIDNHFDEMREFYKNNKKLRP